MIEVWPHAKIYFKFSGQKEACAFMSHDNKKKSDGSKNHKKDGKFHSKNIKHDPSAESARAIFGLNDAPKDKTE